MSKAYQAFSPSGRRLPVFCMEGPPRPHQADRLWALPNVQPMILVDVRKDAQGRWAGSIHQDVWTPLVDGATLGAQLVTTAQAFMAAAGRSQDQPGGWQMCFIGHDMANTALRVYSHPGDHRAFGGAQYRSRPGAGFGFEPGGTLVASSADALDLIGAPWIASHAYNFGDRVYDPGTRTTYQTSGGGRSGQAQPQWVADQVVQDGGITWTPVAIQPIFIGGPGPESNRGVFRVTARPALDRLTVQRWEPLVAMDVLVPVPEAISQDVWISTNAAPDLYRAAARAEDQAAVVRDLAAGVRQALDGPDWPAGLDRRPWGLVGDDESLNDVGAASVAAYWTSTPGVHNLMDLESGWWQTQARDPRFHSMVIDGTYTAGQMIAVAEAILGPLPPLPPPCTAWSSDPRLVQVRVWNWVNARVAFHLRSQIIWGPFVQALGVMPCGNWIQGVLSTGPADPLPIDPGPNPACGLGIDNWAGSGLMGYTSLVSYGGGIAYALGSGDRGRQDFPPPWNTIQNWRTYLDGLGRSIQAAPGTRAEAWEITGQATTVIGRTVKRWYGEDHLVSLSITFQYLWDEYQRGQITLADAQAVIQDMARAIAQAFLARALDVLYCWCPEYADPGAAAWWYDLVTATNALVDDPAAAVTRYQTTVATGGMVDQVGDGQRWAANTCVVVASGVATPPRRVRTIRAAVPRKRLEAVAGGRIARVWVDVDLGIWSRPSGIPGLDWARLDGVVISAADGSTLAKSDARDVAFSGASGARTTARLRTIVPLANHATALDLVNRIRRDGCLVDASLAVSARPGQVVSMSVRRVRVAVDWESQGGDPAA